MEKRTDWKSKNQGGDKQKQKSKLYPAPRRTAQEEENDKARKPYRGVISSRGSNKRPRSTFSILHKFALEEIGTNWVYAIWLTEPPILCSVKVKASIFKASWYGLSCTTTKRRACPNKCQKSFGETLDCISRLCDKPKLSKITIVRQIPKISDLLQSQPTARTNC